MAEVWKEEFHIIGSDGEARDWLESLEEAKAEFRDGDLRIDEVTYYHNDTRTVYKPGERNNECEYCGMADGDEGKGCRVCDRGYYG